MSHAERFKHWRGALVTLAGVLCASLIALALFAPVSAPTSAPVATGPTTATVTAVRDARAETTTHSAARAPTARYPAFRRGINLSRLQGYSRRDPERPGSYLWPPFAGDLATMSEAELDRLRRLGFDFVRLPVDTGPFLAADRDHVKRLLEGLRQWVERLQDHGLAVLLDMHPEPYASLWRPADILADPHGEKFERYSLFLQDVARHFADQPADSFALELMNEPQPECERSDGAEDWTVSQKRLFESVRSLAPSMPLVVTGGCWSSPDGLMRLSADDFDAATLFDVHYYDPYYFTHQSLPWSSPPARYLAGLTYPASRGSVDETVKQTRARLTRMKSAGSPPPPGALAAASREIFSYYKGRSPGRRTTDARFATMADWAKAQAIAPARVVVGEFSATRWPKDVPDDGSRERWLNDVRKAAERSGFAWALWDYTEGFGLLRDNAGRMVDPATVRSLGLDLEALRP